MKNRFWGFATLAVLALAVVMPASAQGTITINQYASPAPNFYGSPSWAGYQANTMNSLVNNLGDIGNPATDPTAYQQLGASFTPGMIEVTSFPSWMGQANPTGAFANELGNRLHWGVTISDAGGTFTLAGVSFAFKSNDTGQNFSGGTCPTGNGGSLCSEGNLSGSFASGAKVGRDINGNPCDVTHPCTDTTPLTYLAYVGEGNAEWPGGSDPDPTNPVLGRQGSMDAMSAYITANISDISNQYCVNGTCNTVTLSDAPAPAPEPASLSVLGLALSALAVIRRRRQTRGGQT